MVMGLGLGIARGGRRKPFPLSLPWLLLYRCGKSLSYTDSAMTSRAAADGDAVRAITDLSSPMTSALIVGTPAAPPTLRLNVLDGQPVWRFPGTSALATQDATVVPITSGYLSIVVNVTGGAVGDYICGGRRSTTGNPIFSFQSAGTGVRNYLLKTDAGISAANNFSSVAVGWQFVEMVWDGANVFGYAGGVQKATAALSGTISVDRFAVGGDWYNALVSAACLTGDVAVAGVMAGVIPSAAQRASLYAWVKAQYPSVA